MARFSRRRFARRGPKDKYSVENKGGTVTTASAATNGWFQNGINIVPPTSVEGMRKIKHTTITLSAPLTEGGVCAYALVYVPEGYTTNALFNAGGSLYEPNQFVMQAGMMDFTAGPIRITSPISRNLNSGDSIWLVVGTTAANTVITYFCKYAITLQWTSTQTIV